MAFLYQSVDLFVSAATSIFETYGKSPLEAIASGVPVVVPYWDGFPYFVNDENGSLVRATYCDGVADAPYSFASIEIDDFANKCCEWLEKENGSINSDLPDWAYYDYTMKLLAKMVQQLLSVDRRVFKRVDPYQEMSLSNYPTIIQKICACYSLETLRDLERKAGEDGFAYQNPTELNLLKEFHHELFGAMDRNPDCIFKERETLVATASGI